MDRDGALTVGVCEDFELALFSGRLPAWYETRDNPSLHNTII